VFSVSGLLFPTVLTLRLSGLATNITYYVFVCQPQDSCQGSWKLQCGERTVDRGQIYRREVDDDEMVPFPEYFEDIQNLLDADLLYSPEVLQGNCSIYTIVRHIIAWYADKAPPSADEPERPKYALYEGKRSSIIWALTIFLYGIDEPDTRTALMNLELCNHERTRKRQEDSTGTGSRFRRKWRNCNSCFSPHADAKQFVQQHSSKTRCPDQCDQQLPRANCGHDRGHHGRNKFAGRRNGGYRKSHSCSLAPQLLL
jgi:hypothetical protein